eukprot:1183509-Rhodomonas_salina.2
MRLLLRGGRASHSEEVEGGDRAVLELHDAVGDLVRLLLGQPARRRLRARCLAGEPDLVGRLRRLGVVDEIVVCLQNLLFEEAEDAVVGFGPASLLGDVVVGQPAGDDEEERDPNEGADGDARLERRLLAAPLGLESGLHVGAQQPLRLRRQAREHQRADERVEEAPAQAGEVQNVDRRAHEGLIFPRTPSVPCQTELPQQGVMRTRHIFIYRHNTVT